MRYTVLILSLVLFSSPIAWAQPDFSDILRTTGVLRGQRGGSDLDKAIQIGSAIYRIHRSRKGKSASIPRTIPGLPQPRKAPRSPQPQTTPPQTQPAPRTAERGRPSGYDYIAVNGKPMRLDPNKLPLSINPGQGEHAAIVRKSIELWNNAGLGTLFVVTQDPADLTVDWSGRSVSPGARAETRMKTSSRIVIPSSISVKKGQKSSYHLARVVTHELGHVLGLDHSQNPNDIMYRSEGQGDLVLSERDLKMLRWLYSQNDYIPVVGSTKSPTGIFSGLHFQPTSFCGHHH